MELSLWDKLSGTLVNTLTVVVGTGLGLLLRGRLPERMARIMVQGVGLTTLFIGLSMAQALGRAKGGALDGVVLGLIALVAGGLLGEWARVEDGLEGLGEKIKQAVRGGGSFTEGFVAASLLFCVGPMTLLGSIQNGLTGDASLLLLKATLDGMSAIALTSSFGIGVGFSTLVILLYQGGVALLAGTLSQALPDPAQDPRVLLTTGVGGLMVLGVGVNLLGLTKVRVGSFLPALLLAPLVWWLAELLT
ncbi:MULTISPECIES: DUF554 domain-containing protein [Thermus]|jgi:uncharacterized membrane protein YqgA involved in biofilm formation|uniref:Putative membrane protein YdfK n=1 Tax=Thermus brockianus TaxID=56956 RepID=A0A1J0LXS1_THEBO|nr:DUF554 domain-containing protein [Thermus brockianus]APD10269.1 putative membrane protein YdfK [Thermus brockianus]BDG16449.1 hypothetical protein TbrSNM41_11830 [Thermus brockianus]